MSDQILRQVNSYYSDKIARNGATPQGVDWNSVESQELRFEVLSNVIASGEGFSVLDYGCGFGSMYRYFTQRYKSFSFTGFDISQVMIDEALKQNQGAENAAWLTGLEDGATFDYTIASGIFNVRLETGDEEWLKYILHTIGEMDRRSVKGFSFNVLTSYSDKEYMRDYLYYADPLFLFDYCKKYFSRNVALLHDYQLYEFTIIVRK